MVGIFLLFLVARSRAGPTLSFRRGNERVTRLTKTRWRFSSRKPAAAEEAGVEAGGEGLLRPPLLRAPPAAGGKGGGGGGARGRRAPPAGFPGAPRCRQKRRAARRRAEVLARVAPGSPGRRRLGEARAVAVGRRRWGGGRGGARR